MDPLDSVDSLVDLGGPGISQFYVVALLLAKLEASVALDFLKFHEVIYHYKVNQVEHDVSLRQYDTRRWVNWL